jgi:hypothetical protein
LWFSFGPYILCHLWQSSRELCLIKCRERGYSESEVETNMDTTALKLEMDTTASGQVVFQEISNQERYAVD